MAESLKSELEGYAVSGVVFLVIAAGILWGIASFSSYRCAERWEGREARFGMVTGCMVRQDGVMVPEEAGR